MKLRYRSLRQWKYETVEVYQHQTNIFGQYCRPDYITLTRDGMLTIDGHYAWDGASGPTWDSPSSMRGSLVHDALTQLVRLGLLSIKFKPSIDLLFHDILLSDGMSPLRAEIWYAGVKLFGKYSCMPSSEPSNKVYEVGLSDEGK